MAEQKCHSSNGFHDRGPLVSVHYVPNVNKVFSGSRIAIFALFSKVKSGESGLTL